MCVCVCVCVCVSTERERERERACVYVCRERNEIIDVLVWFLWFNGTSTIVGYFMPKLYFSKNSCSTIQLITVGIRRFMGY